MKKARKKLTLHRETIGSLTETRLSEAAGGLTLSCGTLCNTVCFRCVSQNTQCNTGCIPCQTQTNCIGTEAC